MEQDHRLNDMGNGCTCKTYKCKKWQDAFPKQGEEKRCPRCWTLASLFESESGQIYDYCVTCATVIT